MSVIPPEHTVHIFDTGLRRTAPHHVAMAGGLRVLSIYEAFFSGGARALHSGVVVGLHEGGVQDHSVLSIYREIRRETIVQRMDDDPRYRALSTAGVPVTCLGRVPGNPADPARFTEAELAAAARPAAGADVILSLKEQPLHLVNQPGFPRRPVIVCLHRSDPENQGTALGELMTAIADGRVHLEIVHCLSSSG